MLTSGGFAFVPGSPVCDMPKKGMNGVEFEPQPMAALQERLIASVRDQQKPRKNDNKVIADGKEYDLSQELPEELKRRHIFDFEGGYRAIIFRFESKEDNAAKNVLGVLLHNHGGNDMKEAFVKVRKLLGVTRKPDKRRFGNAAVIELYWEMPDGQLLPS